MVKLHLEAYTQCTQLCGYACNSPTGKSRQSRKATKEKVRKRKRTAKCSDRNVTAGEETKVPKKM
jgi:hypothetical protein